MIQRSIFIIIWGLTSFYHYSYSQDRVTLNVIPSFLGKTLVLEQEYVWENEPITFTTLKFYITNLTFFKEGAPVNKLPGAFLFDASNESSQAINIAKTFDFDSIEFGIGVDSLTNVSGIFDGDLDPLKGMYWTWQSGFINFKLEGTSKLCNSRKNQFIFHIGGYEKPYNCYRKVSFAIPDCREMNIAVAIDELLRKVNIAVVNQVMSPGENAITVSDYFPTIFKTTN